MSFVLYCFISFIFAIFFYNYYWKRRHFPPGPAPFPLLGNISQFGTKEPNYAKFKELKEQYGEIYTIWAAERPLVILTDFKLLQDTLIKDGDAFAGRVSLGKFNEHVRGGDYGIIFIDGDIWKEHRRFALQVFRNFGMGRGLMEEKIHLELGYFIDGVRSSIENGETVQNLIPKIEITVASIINQLLFGFAYHGDEKVEEFIKIKETINKHMRLGGYVGALFAMHYPKIAPYLPILRNRYYELIDEYHTIIDYCQQQINAHKNAKSNDTEPNDYVDAYLREAERQGKDSTFTEKQLVNALYDMFIAGQETTSNTIIFTIIYALNYPEKLKNLHNELDKVIGNDRRITFGDKNSLPYCNAFIYESQRLVNLLASNLPHKLLRDVEIRGYQIPKGTVIIPQISTILFDDKVFPDPLNFIPERFIDENGDLKRIDEFIPFSMGKRQCLGESLAKMELYLIITNFFNHFNITPLNDEKLPSMKKIRGITVQPYPFECNITKRY